MPKLLLASGSPYRRQLLERLHLPFETDSPDIDESPRPGEAPDTLAVRLARGKALALAPKVPQDTLIIGSDQVASLDGRPLGKPGNHERAREQLRAAQGNRLSFYTGLCLYDARNGQVRTHCELFAVQFRPLTDSQIDQYLAIEQPYDCAGAFKMEGLGIRLFERLEGDDPNSLIGLPLIALTDLLLAAGVDPLLP